MARPVDPLDGTASGDRGTRRAGTRTFQTDVTRALARAQPNGFGARRSRQRREQGETRRANQPRAKSRGALKATLKAHPDGAREKTPPPNRLANRPSEQDAKPWSHTPNGPSASLGTSHPNPSLPTYLPTHLSRFCSGRQPTPSSAHFSPRPF
ncbi:hypothetical protein BDY21DRAFT_350983 [Lineolata rhizophorae]|uniref:Uncharacterized protein n=1 Tax=Lineolata rhizophorae TaxID=578093 RepID=A0A6A6NUA5_9PEZI|nr:hypothetical protein BDY21DRAFT_350983 [Lineolata rhizophorae]